MSAKTLANPQLWEFARDWPDSLALLVRLQQTLNDRQTAFIDLDGVAREIAAPQPPGGSYGNLHSYCDTSHGWWNVVSWSPSPSDPVSASYAKLIHTHHQWQLWIADDEARPGDRSVLLARQITEALQAAIDTWFNSSSVRMSAAQLDARERQLVATIASAAGMEADFDGTRLTLINADEHHQALLEFSQDSHPGYSLYFRYQLPATV
jgi:hypothetical protein